jgi:hypothetical protein
MIKRILISTVLVVALCAGPAWSALATFAVDPPVSMGQPAQTVTFRVHVSTAEDIGALQFTLEYNSAIVTYQSVVRHPSMPLGFNITNVNTNLQAPGPYSPGTNENVLVQMSGNGINQSFTGEQDVATLTFLIRPNACGPSPMNFDITCQRTHLATIDLLPICDPTLVGGLLAPICNPSDSPPLPGAEALRLRNTPNPFNPRTTIRFELASATPVDLRIFDVHGRNVRALLDASLSEGPHAVGWDGRDDAGRQLPSGAYYYRLTTSSTSATRRMLMLK